MEKKAYPVSHIIGFVFSLIMTFAAAGVALKTNLSFKTIMWIIGTLAVLQAGLQLTMFMHVSEGEDSKTNTVNMIYAIFTAICIVAGTIWVMSFGMHDHM
ncbi:MULTISPECIES: cytochrome aa3 quinol oxidase subunit IV [unclassified Bacillus (in: firmicutes)]|uniref:cytochrome aa3 quinol oxidase subunit IV n=1 Tax=unclassified Bacillus (in: firmicutes) TaxID=185979 RepID=UPI0008E6697F|nr:MULTISPECIES: cytochrome aa3 quinol oxidase subunit IV [unclassified Bacillus (in: firmicutes)]SFA85652.1 cytochrome aa3 quinol oxidase subunit 4 [Bacillus sp. UNCCL13]SFQ83491.1 cytochrome aa3 quinol oxidase subunit 4 [Bacillus sp. cl95]